MQQELTDSAPYHTTHGMLLRLVVCAGIFLSLGGWLLWGRNAEPSTILKGEVICAWGLTGVQPGEMNRPRAIKAVADGSLYVIDRSGRLQRFSREGKPLGDWRFPAWQNGTPTSVTLHPNGNLIVANTHYSNILVYDRKGKLLLQFGERGQGPGRMFMPTDAMAGQDGSYFVLEREPWKDKIMQFSSEGKFMKEWGSSGDQHGQFVRPMALDFDKQGHIWIADSCNHRLECFTPDGKFIKSIGEQGTEAGKLDYPYDLAIGPNGELVVAEYGNNRIQVFTTEGKSLGVFGGAGNQVGRFASPWGVDCDSQGVIWVADTLNDRVQGIRIEWPKG